MLGRKCSKAVVSSEWSRVDRGQEMGGKGAGPALEVSLRRPPGGGDNRTVIFLMRSQHGKCWEEYSLEFSKSNKETCVT